MPRRKLTTWEKRDNRKQDAWILFIKNKIEMKEYHTLLAMCNSTEEDLVLATAIIKEKFRKKLVNHKVD